MSRIPDTYRITFKGKEAAEILDAIKGKRLYDGWLADNLPERIELRRGYAISSSSIKTIELFEGAASNNPFADPKYDGFLREFIKLDPVSKSTHLDRFTLSYRMRMQRDGKPFRQCLPSPTVLEKARKIQEEFYRRNPNAYLIPIKEYGELLAGPIIAPLADKWPTTRT